MSTSSNSSNNSGAIAATKQRAIPKSGSKKKSPSVADLRTYENQALARALNPSVHHDPHSGTWQKTIAPFLQSLTHSAEYIRAGQAYLNPGHQSNAADAVPLPDGTPGRTFLFKSTWNQELNMGDRTNVVFYNLPFFEAPFAHWDSDSSRLNCFYSPAAGSTGGPNPAGYMHGHNVYRYRCLGKSMTIVNTTAIINRRGTCTVARKTPDVDYVSRQFTVGTTTDAVNQPILQNIPFNLQGVSSLTGTTETWDAAEGAYLVSHHSDHLWVTREDQTQKAYPTSLMGACVNTALQAKTTLGTTQAYYGTAVNSVNVGPQDHTDIPMAAFTGIAPGGLSTFNVKCVVVYEFQLKLDSDLIPYTVERPLMSPGYMDALFAYEASLPMGGMTADANSWGDIWKGFKKFWGNGGSTITKTGLNALMPGAGNVSSLIGDFATSKF